MMRSILLWVSVLQRRELVIELVRRQLKLRYRGTWLGFLWTLLNPLVFMVVYTLVISYFLRVGIPRFPAFLLVGLLPWTMWFSEGILGGTTSIVDHAGFLRNAVFPAEVLPVVAVASGMINYLFSLPVLLVIFALYHVRLPVTAIALPLVMAAQFMLMLGIVYLTCTSEVFFRDTRFIVQHGVMVMFFLTPVMYDFTVVPSSLQWILKINPMTVVIDSYRQVLYYGAWPNWRNLGLTLAFGLGLCAFGAWLFQGAKEAFSEYL